MFSKVANREENERDESREEERIAKHAILSVVVDATHTQKGKKIIITKKDGGGKKKIYTHI